MSVFRTKKVPDFSRIMQVDRFELHADLAVELGQNLSIYGATESMEARLNTLTNQRGFRISQVVKPNEDLSLTNFEHQGRLIIMQFPIDRTEKPAEVIRVKTALPIPGFEEIKTSKSLYCNQFLFVRKSLGLNFTTDKKWERVNFPKFRNGRLIKKTPDSRVLVVLKNDDMASFLAQEGQVSTDD